MKILHTVNRYHPEVGGSEEAVRQISERLVRLGHEVTVATRVCSKRTGPAINGVIVQEFECSGNLIEGITGESETYRTFVRDGGFDLVMNYGAQIWCTDLLFDMLPHLRAKKVFVPCCYYRLSDPRYTSYFQNLAGVLGAYDRIIYFSQRNDDCRFALARGLGNGTVIPNGASLQEFDEVGKGSFRRRLGIGSEPLVINVSNHGWLKNHDFFWKCVPGLKEAGAVPVLIGEPYRPAPLKWVKECYPRCRMEGFRNRVTVLEGCSRRSVVEAFVDADIFLFGSRYECSPLVMFESFASRTLFVTTDCGNVADLGDAARIVSSEKEAISIVREHALDRSRFEPFLDRGEELVRTRHNWDVVAQQYEVLYRKLVHGGA